jgi:putative Holliday junction resolvase
MSFRADLGDHCLKAMRVVGIDLGERRVGVAISDATRTLARPVKVLTRPASDDQALGLVAAEIQRLGTEEEEGIESIVLGLPTRLDGTPNDMTPRVRAFGDALRAATGLPVVLQDERLSSREAESRLALREKSWRARKRKLDAAAAAVILQDYLDALHG